MNLITIHREWDTKLTLAGYDIPAITGPRDATDAHKVAVVRAWKRAMVEALSAYALRMAESAKGVDENENPELWADIINEGFTAVAAAKAIGPIA